MIMMMMKCKCINVNYIRHLPCCESGFWVLQELQQVDEWLQKTKGSEHFLRLLWGISTQRPNDVKDHSGKRNNALGMYERSTLASLQVQVNHQAVIECYTQAGSTFPRRQRRTRT